MTYTQILGIAAVTLVALICVFMVSKKQSRKKFQEKLKESKKNLENEKQDSVKSSGISISKKNDLNPTPVEQSVNKPRSSKIQIKKRQSSEISKEMSEKDFNEIISKQTFLNFDLNELWSDTQLTDIFMGEDCCNRLDDYLKKENLEQTAFEANMIPEIGGILLGRYSKDDQEKYRITLEEFIPIDSVNPNLYTLEFCTDSLVKELGDAIDTHPELSVVGWFHTHPGHGLFLSIPDLTIQMGFFKEPYQVAMEIDSLSRNLDTGFFTQKDSGKMNNSLYEKPKWYSWKSIIEAIHQI